MSEIIPTSVKSFGIFSMIESAAEIKFFLLAVNFILWVDSFFIYIHKPGVIALANASELQISWQLIIILVMAFLFTSSIVLPMLSFFINKIYVYFFSERVDKFLDRDTSKVPRNYVSEYALEEKAHLTKDKFLLDLYNSHKKIQSENNASMKKACSLALNCLILLSINYVICKNEISVSHFAIDFLSNLNSMFSSNVIFVFILWLIGLAFYRFHLIWDDYIYCPSLYREIEGIEEKEKWMMAQQSCPFPNKN